MDWKLTVNIYIVVFLLLNITLGYILYSNYDENSDVLQSTESTLEDANIEIEQIVMAPEEGVPQATASMYEFTAENTTTQTDFVVSDDNYTITYDVSAEDISMDLEILAEYKEVNIFNGTSYRYSEAVSDMTHQVFLQYYNGFPIFDASSAKLTMTGENRTVETYEQSLLHNFEEVETLFVDAIITPQGIVESMYTRGFIEENSIIELIQIGYDTVTVEEGRVLLRPAYEVIVVDEVGNERQFVVDAISLTGAIRERE